MNNIKTLRENDIPIIDVDTINDAVEELSLVLGHMDRLEKKITKEAENNLKVIVAQMQPDYVQPYKNWGSHIPFVLYSTHPEYKKGTRLDKGYTSLSLDSGYLIVIISINGKQIIPVQEYLDSNWCSSKETKKRTTT